MAIASMRKRTRTLSPSYRNDKGFELDSPGGLSAANQRAFGGAGRHASAAGSSQGPSGAGPGGSMGSEPDI